MIDGSDSIRKLFLGAAGASGLARLAGHFTGGLGVILMLHRTTAYPARPLGVNRGLNVHPDFLDGLIGLMKSDGYHFVSMDEMSDIIAAGGRNSRFATITLDDGYRDNLTEALPIFEKHGTPFTVYVAPALTEGKRLLWWELIEDIALASDSIRVPGGEIVPCNSPSARDEAIERLRRLLWEELAERDQDAVLADLAAAAGIDPHMPGRDLLMDWSELRILASHPLATIGAHTVGHFALRRLTADDARREIADCADILAERLGTRPRHLAFPYGHAAAVGAREVTLASEAGYTTAVTTRHGTIRAAHAAHPHALPRISVNGRFQRMVYMRALISGISTPLANRGRLTATV